VTAVVGRSNGDVHILTNMQYPPTNDNFFDEHGNALKTEMLQDYSRHVGYIDL
jgi:hypothetical protein